jgi:hypothetical protein
VLSETPSASMNAPEGVKAKEFGKEEVVCSAFQRNAARS